MNNSINYELDLLKENINRIGTTNDNIELIVNCEYAKYHIDQLYQLNSKRIKDNR